MRNKPRKSNENAFMTILNLIVDPAVIVGEKGQILLVNNTFEDLTGLSKEVIGKVFLEVDLLTPESKAILLKNLMKRMQGLPVEPYEITFTDKTGKARCAEVKAKKIDYAGQSADLVIFRDITRRKENARRLKEYSEKMEALVEEKAREIKEQKEKLETIFNSSPDAITVADLNGNIIECNEAALHLLGFSSRDDLIGKNSLEMVSPKERKKASRLMKELFRNGSVKSAELAFLTKDGKEFSADTSASIITDATGNPVGFVTMTRDITERKKAEEALRGAEHRFRNIFEQANDAFIYLDKFGKILDVNAKAIEMFGGAKEKLLGKHFTKIGIFSIKLVPVLMRNFMNILTGKEVNIEIQIKNKKQQQIDLECSATLLKTNESTGIMVIARDITEWKQAQQALTDSEEMFRAISTSAVDAIILVDERGKIVYWNPAAERIFGYTQEEAVGKNVLNLLIPPRDHSFQPKFVEQLQSSKQIQGKTMEFTALRKDGSEFPAELSATLLRFKGKSCLLGIIRDVSERKKMEDELKQERDMLESVTENIGAGLAVISKDYRILWANKLLKQAGDIENKVCYSTFNTIDTVCPDCGVKKVFETGVSFDSHEYRCPFEKGKDRWIELIVTPIKDKNGAVIAALELSIDITEKKLMQNKLAEYSQKLEKIVEKRTEQLKQTQAKLVKSERLATIGELAAMVGHDLRNPLTGIMGAAYYLKTKHGTEVGAKGKEMLEIIENAINYSNKIINDLLEYSRDLKLKLTETTPKAMLQSALSLLEVPEKIQIIDATKDKPMVKADTEKIRNVFVNIIQNAIDAMPEGGTLTIKSRKAKGTLEIAFKDTGAGMSEEALSKLKGGVPLFTTKSKGMGFGLPICRRLVEAHGGKISVESMAGKGTTVTVTIPVNSEPVDEGEEKWIFSESMLSAITAANRAR
jgi:PAS domain S-box-containing protein